MDTNYNVHQNGQGSQTFNAGAQLSQSQRASFPIASHSLHQPMYGINSQLESLDLSDSGTNYLDALLAMSPRVPPPPYPASTGPFYVASVQETPYQSGTAMQPTTTGMTLSPVSAPHIPPQMSLRSTIATSSYMPQGISGYGFGPLSPNIHGGIDQGPYGPNYYGLANQTTSPVLPNFYAPGNLQLNVGLKTIQTQTTDTTNESYYTGDSAAGPKGVQGNVNVPTSLPLHHTNFHYQGFIPPQAQSPQRPLATSTPPGPRSPNTSFENSPQSSHSHLRQRGSLPASETSSTTSSTSIPSSPVTSGMAPLLSFHSDGSCSPGTRSPASPDMRCMNGDVNRIPTSPIESKSLHITIKYPQDKCYKCLKKVYPMERIGPVKEVVYHKGCFCCKVCNTKLNLKTYCHNQNDTYDVNVYCKSHQPEKQGKGGTFDTDSVFIKGAMSRPKLNQINEQIRGDPLEKWKPGHLDAHSIEIAHAMHVPALDTQSANKLRHYSWRKEDRKSESVPPPDVIRYDAPVPEYDLESLERLQVESFPDYDR